MPNYDLVVVGGGIHGAGVTQAAVAAGYKVLLLEKTGLAAGTSSRSSKLIHGGLRYLESMEFGLVKECLYERALLLKLAPELVKLVPMHIPIFSDTKRRPWQIRAGLSLYALLGSLEKSSLYCNLPRKKWSGLDGMIQNGLQAVFRYSEAQTHDALLTRAVVKSAVSLGAELAEQAEFLQAERDGSGYAVRWREGSNEKFCSAKVLVNATGPWANEVLSRVCPEQSPVGVDLVQGAHIVLAGQLEQGFYYVEAPQDARAVFLMPWGQNTLVGTTEHLYEGEPGKVFPLDEERNYLRTVASCYFPRFADAGLLSEFAGLRVLPVGKGGVFGRSRETIFQMDDKNSPHLLSIFGGKLTAYRATAQTVLKKLLPTLPRSKAIADTTKLQLDPP